MLLHSHSLTLAHICALDLRQLAQEDQKNGVAGVIDIPAEGDEAAIRDAVIKNVIWQMDQDRKVG